MEPLFGGTLANPPPPVREIWDAAGGLYNPADLALRWLWDKPEVSLVLSGMNTLNQVQQNLASACRSKIGSLTEAETSLIARLQEKYQQLSPIPCSKCGYCLPCPNGVNIPVNLELFNNASVFQGNSVILCRNLYNILSESERARACQECHTCEELCPQQIPISEMMAKVRDFFS
jgi:predicted aldo/keto reductase-like oxidoreductase